MVGWAETYRASVFQATDEKFFVQVDGPRRTWFAEVRGRRLGRWVSDMPPAAGCAMARQAIKDWVRFGLDTVVLGA